MFCKEQRIGLLSSVTLIALVSVIVGCGAGGGTDGADEVAELRGSQTESSIPPAAETKPVVVLAGAWLLEDLGGLGVMDMVQTTIEFDAEGGVFGSGGCNRFTGSYTFENGSLEFSPLAGTKMMCPEAVMDQEDRFHQALAAVGRVEMDGPFLLIFYQDSQQPLRFTRVDPVD